MKLLSVRISPASRKYQHQRELQRRDQRIAELEGELSAPRSLVHPGSIGNPQASACHTPAHSSEGRAAPYSGAGEGGSDAGGSPSSSLGGHAAGAVDAHSLATAAASFRTKAGRLPSGVEGPSGDEEAAELRQQLAYERKERQELERQLAAAQRELAGASAKERGAKAGPRREQAEVEDLEAQLAAALRQVGGLELQRGEAAEGLAAALQQLEEAEEALEKEQAQGAAHGQALKELKAQHAELEKEHARLLQERQEEREAASRTAAQLITLQGLSAAQTEALKAELEDLQKALQEQESQDCWLVKQNLVLNADTRKVMEMGKEPFNTLIGKKQWVVDRTRGVVATRQRMAQILYYQ